MFHPRLFREKVLCFSQLEIGLNFRKKVFAPENLTLFVDSFEFSVDPLQIEIFLKFEAKELIRFSEYLHGRNENEKHFFILSIDEFSHKNSTFLQSLLLNLTSSSIITLEAA